MSYRIPTHLGFHVPPPMNSAATSGAQPVWKGTFVVSGLRASDTASNVEIYVKGIDLDMGDW